LTLPNGTIREQLAALLGNATDGPIFPQSGPLANFTGGLLNPPNWTELLQPFGGPSAGSVGIQAPNWTQILAPFRGAGLQLPEDGVLDGAIRSQLTTMLTNALSSGGGGGGGILDGSIFPQSGAGIFPMSAGNWLQLLTSAATGNGQQLFSTLAGNAIRNQLLASFGNAIGGGGGGGGGLFDGGIFAQSGTGVHLPSRRRWIPLRRLPAQLPRRRRQYPRQHPPASHRGHQRRRERRRYRPRAER
jgi:hypothetical protein